MTINDLLLQLQKNYDIICFVDLECVTQSPDQIYKILNSHYRSRYQSNQRLVFYTQHRVPTGLIRHILEACFLVDISPNFILICCNENLDHEIKNAGENFGIFDHSIEFYKTEIQSKNLDNKYLLPDTVCPLPWYNLEIRHNGQISPCCVSTDIIGSVEDGIDNLFHGPDMDQLRQDFIKGTKPKGCNYCWQLENKGLVTNRMRHRQFLLKDILKNGLATPILQNLDLKFGSTCNFKCRICNAGSSSAYAEEQARFYQTKFIVPANWANTPDNLQQIENLLPNLTNIDMYGGEPFLLKSFDRVLKLAVEKGYAKNIRLHYNSNGSVYPTRALEHWPHFKHIDLQFSIDAIGDRFELERGGSWSVVEENIIKLKNLNLANCEISIMPAINVMNVFYIDEVVDWAKKHGFKINPLYVTSPPGYSLAALTGEAKLLLKQKYADYDWPEMKNILSSLVTTANNNGQEFIRLTKHFDALRNENFSKSHPEIAHAMGYTDQNL